MRALRIFLAVSMTLCLLSFPACASTPKRGEVLAALKTPAGMELTEESLKSGRVRRYIDLITDEAGGKTAGVFDALTLANKERYIFVFIVSDEKTSEQLAAALKKNPNVVSASPNRQMHLN